MLKTKPYDSFNVTTGIYNTRGNLFKFNIYLNKAVHILFL